MPATETLNSGVLYTDRRTFYPEPNRVHRLWGGLNPFNTIIEKLNTFQVPDVDFRTFEYKGNQHNPVFTSAAGFTMTAAGTESAAITVTSSGTSPALGLIVDVYKSDGTYMGQGVITTRTSTTVFEITPTYTASAAATGTSTTLEVVGHAAEEGSESPEAWSQELTMAYNSCATLRTPLELTGTLMEATLRGQSERERLRFEKGREHQQLRENAFLFSRRKSDNNVYTEDANHITGAGSKQIRTTHGFIPMVSDNAPDNIHTIVKANHQWKDWVALQKLIWKYSNAGMTKMAGCGDDFLAWLHQFAAEPGSDTKIQLQLDVQTSQSMGFKVWSVMTGFGDLSVFRVPTLTNASGGRYSGYALIFDPEEIGKAQYRPSRYFTNIKTDNNYDGIKDEYFSDEGLYMNLPERHHILKAV